MEEKPISRPGLALKVSLRVVLFLPLTGALFFLSAGSLAFWNAWLLLATIFVLMAVMMTWLLIRDPALLAKRMRTKERRPAQKCFVAFSLVWVLGAFVLPGLDVGFGCSALRVWLVLAAYGLMCLGDLI